MPDVLGEGAEALVEFSLAAGFLASVEAGSEDAGFDSPEPDSPAGAELFAA